MSRNVFKKLRRAMATILSVLLVATMVTPVGGEARTIPDTASSYAYGNQLYLGLLAQAGLLSDASGNPIVLDTLTLMEAEQAWLSSTNNGQIAQPQNIDVGVLSSLYITLPTLPPIPLLGSTGLLRGDLGVLREYANAPYATEATGAAGLLNSDGSLDLHPPTGSGNVSLELTTLLGLDSLVLNGTLDRAALELGAVSALAEKPDSFLDGATICSAGSNPVVYSNLDNSSISGTYGILSPPTLDEDDGKFCSNYQITDAIVVIDSPLVDNLTSGITTLINGLDDNINTLLSGTGVIGALRTLLGNLNFNLLGLGLVTATTTADVEVLSLPLGDVVTQLTDPDEPLSDKSGLVYLNLGTGEIKIDLHKLHTSGLNSLDPNTPLVSAEQITKITDALNAVLLADSSVEPNGLNARLEELLYGGKDASGKPIRSGGLYDTEVEINLGVSLSLAGLTVAQASVTLTSTLGGLLNPAAATTTSKSIYEADKTNNIYLQSSGAGDLIALILTLLTSVTGTVGGAVEGVLFGTGGGGLAGGLLQGVIPLANSLISGLDPVLKAVIQPLANVLVNRQKVEQKTQGNLFTVSALEVNVLQGTTLATLPLATASVMAQSFEPASLELGKFVENPDNVTVPGAYFLEYVCTNDDFSSAYSGRVTNDIPPIPITDRLSGTVSIAPATTETISDLPAGSSCVVSESNPINDPTVIWTGKWTTDRLWTSGNAADATATPVTLTPNDTAFVAAVNIFESAFIDLDINVADVGDGRGLHAGSYQYGLVCSLDTWNSGQLQVSYPQGAIGEGYSFKDGRFSLLGDTSGTAPGPVQVLPGAECIISTTAGITAYPELRSTGPTPNREPFTYFLYTDAGQPIISDLPTDATFTLDGSGVVNVDSPTVGSEWKTHAYTFRIPTNATDYSLNVAHAYEIDTREYVIAKDTQGAVPADARFDFQYSTDGTNWTPHNGVAAGGSFTITVPVVDATLQPYDLILQEILENTPDSPVSGPVVTWKVNGVNTTGTYRTSNGTWLAESTIGVGPVPQASDTTTPPIGATVTNSYAGITVDKHIDGLYLGGSPDTTVLLYGTDTMTIRYTVSNVGAVDLDTIQLFDISLYNNPLFELPAGITVDGTTGQIQGCSLTFGTGTQAECSFEVSLTSTSDPFSYEASAAGATAKASTTIDNRTIEATASDRHGALRLSDLAALLPATGVTTLVWALGLGILLALAALVFYIRVRK